MLKVTFLRPKRKLVLVVDRLTIEVLQNIQHLPNKESSLYEPVNINPTDSNRDRAEQAVSPVPPIHLLGNRSFGKCVAIWLKCGEQASRINHMRRIVSSRAFYIVFKVYRGNLP